MPQSTDAPQPSVLPAGDAPAGGILARVIANPVSGGARDHAPAMRTAIGRLVEGGWTVGWRATRGAGHARDLAMEAVQDGVNVVVVAGGDGTINEVVNGLVDSDTALAVLPAGTANVLAAQLGLVGVPTPLHRPNLPAIAEELLQGHPRSVDVGFAKPRSGAGRYFLLWAGVGLDAAVAHDLEQQSRDLKRLLGPAAFGALGLKQTALHPRGTEAIIRMDEHRVRDRLFLAVMANIPLYGGTIRLAPGARLDDGRLNVALFCGDTLLSAVQRWLGDDVRSVVQHLGAVITGRSRGDRPVTAPVRKVRIVAKRGLPVHLDAEPFGTTPVTFEARAASIRLWIPPSAPHDLFADDPGSEGSAPVGPGQASESGPGPEPVPEPGADAPTSTGRSGPPGPDHGAEDGGPSPSRTSSGTAHR